MSVAGAAYLATFLYLLPHLLVWLLRARRDRESGEFALDLPLVTAADMLLVLLLARLFTLETAILVSRAGWVLGAAAFGFVARRRPDWRAGWGWPSCLRARDLLPIGLATCAAVLLSMEISRECHIADRAWHIPLVVSIRGQTIPFSNVYDPGGTLAYHIAGDVLGAMLQTLSLGILHASHALSLAHDIVFGLAALTIALFLHGLGVRRSVAIVAASVAPLLSGPLTLLRPDPIRPRGGYNFINYLKLSFRPHACLAGLLMLGFALLLLARSREGKPLPPRAAVPVLLSTCALLSITDEASVAIVGLALGVTWLFVPEVIHPRRGSGVWILGMMAAGVVLANVAFGGTLANGRASHEITLVPWRSPGYYQPELALSEPEGLSMLKYDLFPSVSILAGGIGTLFFARSRRRPAPVLFVSTMLLVSVLLLTRIDIDGHAVESHRFMTAAMFLSPVFGAFWLLDRRGGTTAKLVGGSLSLVAILSGMSLGAMSTLEWMRAELPKKCTQPTRYFSHDDFFEIDCRKSAGAVFGLRPEPHYLAQPVWYSYAGCRPVFSAGPPSRYWEFKVGRARFGRPAFQEIHRTMVKRGQNLTIICPPGYLQDDYACIQAARGHRCAPQGADFLRCKMGTRQRDLLVKTWPSLRKKPHRAPPKPEPDDDHSDQEP